MKQTLDPIQHILDKLSQEDCEDLIDFFSELYNTESRFTKIGTVDVFDEIYPKKEPTQHDKDVMATFGYEPVKRPKFTYFD